LPTRVPGKAARALKDGANLVPEHAVGHRAWEDFLAERLGRRPRREPVTETAHETAR
jgi:hypothetical protein